MFRSVLKVTHNELACRVQNVEKSRKLKLVEPLSPYLRWEQKISPRSS
jgi:hypothetical protein